MNQDELLSLIDGIYGASASDGAGWPAILQRLADVFGAGDASLSAVSTTAVPWLVAPRSDPAFLASYAAYYHPLNLFWQRTSRLPVGQAAIDAMVMPREELQASEFYNDWSLPQDYLHVMGATLLMEEDWRVEFVVPGKYAFGPRQIKLYQAIAPHLTRALQMAHRLGRVTMEHAGAADALDRLSQAVLMVDSELRVLFANRAANALFGNGMNLAGGILQAGLRAQTRELHRMVAGCALGTLENAGGQIAISRGAGQPPLSLLVIPAKSQPGWLAGRQACAMIFATDPETIATPDMNFLQRQFAMTPAEALLTCELLKGDGIIAAAGRIGIAVPTARTQLSSALTKTGAKRQADLVRLVLNSDSRLLRQ
jgi:DNA-binding CsgD family transcriptional regulator/PAS domain-containing protein